MAPPARANSSERGPLLQTSNSASHISQDPDVGYALWSRYTEQYDDTGSSDERHGETSTESSGLMSPVVTQAQPARPQPPRFFLGREDSASNNSTRPAQRPSRTSLRGGSAAAAIAAASPRTSVSFANVDTTTGINSNTNNSLPPGARPSSFFLGGGSASRTYAVDSSGESPGDVDVDEAHATGSSEDMEMSNTSAAKMKTRARSSSNVSKSGNGNTTTNAAARRTQSKALSGELDEESSSSDYYSRPRTRILSPRSEAQTSPGHSGDYFNYQNGNGYGNGRQPQTRSRSRSRSRDARFHHHHFNNRARSMTEPLSPINVPAQVHTGSRAPQALGGQYIVEPWNPHQAHPMGLGLEGTDGTGQEDLMYMSSPVNGPFGFAMGAAAGGGNGRASPLRTNTPPTPTFGSGSGFGFGSRSSTPTGSGSITPILVNNSLSGSSGSTNGGAPGGVVGSRPGVNNRRQATFVNNTQGQGSLPLSPLGTNSPLASPGTSVYLNQFPGPFAGAANTNSVIGSPNWSLNNFNGGGGGGGSGTATPRTRYRNSYAAAPPSSFRLSGSGNRSTPDLQSRAGSTSAVGSSSAGGSGGGGSGQPHFEPSPSTTSLHAYEVDVNAHLRPNPWISATTSRAPSSIGFNFATSPFSGSSMRLSHISTPLAKKSLYKLSKPRRSTALFTGAGTVDKPWLKPPTKKSEIVSDLDKRYANYKKYHRFSSLITYAFVVLGLACAAALAFSDVKQTMGTIFQEGELCMVLEEDFTDSGSGTGLSSDVWNFEIRMDGFGNGEFEMTTDSPNNTFIRDGILYLVPTLTSDVIGKNAVFDGFTFNLTDCTAPATPAPVSNSTGSGNSTTGGNSTSVSASGSRSQSAVPSAAASAGANGGGNGNANGGDTGTGTGTGTGTDTGTGNGNGGTNGNNGNNNGNNGGNNFFLDFSASSSKASNSSNDQNPTAAGPISPTSPGINPACRATSNNGSRIVINPVMSSRITTRGKKNLRFGRVEVRARMPVGDWLWPAIWMLPENNTYGEWPLSGEIDIVESRGNGISYTKQGSNFVRASLNWGPTVLLNSAFRTFGWWFDKRKSFANDFHTYVLEWDETYIRSYVDSRLHRMLEIKFNEPFFKRGKFPGTVANGSEEVILQNPWEGQGNAAPFDQSFYLIMDVAVGGTSGWFPDGAGGKPWLDNSGDAMYSFANAQDTWFSTWPLDVTKRGMAVDYVKMWQKCSTAP